MTEWKPDVMIYHSPCDDGFGAAWAAWMRWGDTVEYLPCNYGQTPPDVTGKHVLIGDFSFKRDVLLEMARSAASIVVLDHHKTAQADLSSLPELLEPGLCDLTRQLREINEALDLPILVEFDMERSGARMVWDFCHPDKPTPELIRYIEDRDLWRFKLDNTRIVSLLIRSYEYDFGEWMSLANQLDHHDQRNRVLLEAAAIGAFYDRKVADTADRAWQGWVASHTVPIVNCNPDMASDVGHALLDRNPDAPFVASYCDGKEGRRGFSLRSRDDRMDVSEIASAHGGGGHRNAAGFSVPMPVAPASAGSE